MENLYKLFEKPKIMLFGIADYIKIPINFRKSIQKLSKSLYFCVFLHINFTKNSKTTQKKPNPSSKIRILR